MSKISEYANSVTVLETGDLLDVSELISTGPDVYESRKMTGSVLANFIAANSGNIMNSNGLTLGGNYTHDLAGNSLVFDGGAFGTIGEIGVTADDVARVNVFVAGNELGQTIFSVKNAGNVGVGTLSPNASAVLDVSSTTGGVLLPNMTTIEKNAITTPAESLFLYDTDLNRFEFYNGSSWGALDSNFANTDLTLTGARTHDLNGNLLTIRDQTNESVLNMVASQSTDFVETRLGFGGNYMSLSLFGSSVRSDLNNKQMLVGLYNHGPMVLMNKGALNNAEIWFNISNGSSSDGLASKRRLFVSNTTVAAHNISNFIVDPNNTATPAAIGSEVISLQDRTAVFGTDTLPASTAFEIYDGDTTPSKLWDFRNNGDVYLGAEQTLFNVASDSKTALGIWDRNGSDKQVKVGTGAFRDINELAFLATGRSSSGLLDSAFQFHDFIFEAPDSAIFGIAGASGSILNLHYNGGLNSLTSTSTEYGFNNQLRYFTSEETFWLGRGFVKEQSGNKRPNTMLHLFDYSQGGQGGLTFFVGDRTATGTDSVLRGGQIRWDINTRNTTSFSNDFITLTPNGNATGNLYYVEFKNTGGSVALKINGNDALPQLPEFTVAGVPTADADNKGGFVCITDETGGYVTAFSDGTNWRRTTDRAIIS